MIIRFLATSMLLFLANICFSQAIDQKKEAASQENLEQAYYKKLAEKNFSEEAIDRSALQAGNRSSAPINKDAILEKISYLKSQACCKEEIASLEKLLETSSY